MKSVKLIMPVILLATVSGCTMVNDEEWVRLRQDMSDLRKESQDMNKAKEALRLQIDGLKKQMQEMEKSTAGELSSRISSVEKASVETDKDLRNKQADTAADITGLRSDFQVLTGRFEETRYAMQKSLQEGKMSREETDSRNKEISQRIEDLEKRISALEQALLLLKQQKEQTKEKVSEAPPFEETYKDAYDTFEKKDYKTARDKFQKYLEQYPDSKYAENAAYWIGESYYSEKKYERAIVVFDDVVKKYPNGAKVPAALLKQGMAFSALGDNKSAKAIFNKLVSSHPKSEQAEVAKKKLKEKE